VIGRPGAVALARALNALFFIAVSAYCLLAYTPFAYDLFIKPSVSPALTDFVRLSPWLYWLTLLITSLTLMPQLRGERAAGASRAYIAVSSIAGVAFLMRPPLDTIGGTPLAFAAGLIALVPPCALAAIDHISWPSVRIRPAGRTRALLALLLAASISCAAYTVAVPIRIGQMLGAAVPGQTLAVGFLWSFALHVFAATVVYLAVMSISGISAFAMKPGAAEYWLSIGLLALAVTLTVYGLICASIAFEGGRAWVASAALGATVAAAWADVARMRAGFDSPLTGSVSNPLMVSWSNHERPADHVLVEPRIPRSSFDGLRTSDTYPTHPTDPTDPTDPTSTQLLAGSGEIDALDLLAAPIVGVRRPRAVAIGVTIALPIIAYALVDAVREFDWNFLLQKLSVLVVWMLAATSAYAIVRSARWPSNAGRSVVPAVVLVVYQLFAWTCPLAAVDAYVPVDPALRLLRDVAIAHPSDTARFYAFLRANTLFGPWQIHKHDVAFVEPLRATAGPRPHIFLIVVDSLRRDYLSPYNSTVTFTPAIQTLAADSFVFARAFTRYAGTALSVPGIWAGGMVPHVIRQPEFARRNTLLKLLNANGYVRVMDMDAINEELVPRDDRLVELDKGRAPMEYDLCRTLDELQRKLPERGSHPAFFYTLPQSVHIAVATQRRVPPGESYPRGFDNRIASSVRRVDGCIGGFVDFLKREGEYDNSIIVLTSDHGDSLGEEGRWGHAYYMFPEVMNVPLIVHLPPSIRARLRTDLDAVVFSTDISPSLYAALGYEPEDLGPLFGRSFFARRDDASSLRRRDPFLVASSYGAVYGTLRQNGRRLYAVDSVDGTEYLFDMTGPPSKVPVTAATAASNRRVIEQQLNALASTLGYER